MSFTVKDWRNADTYAGGGDESTPLSAEALEDLEERVTDYSAEVLPVLNVKNYGAVGGGVGDDTAGVQAALSAADAGQTVDLAGDTYAITSGLTLATDGVRLANGGLLGASHTLLTVSGEEAVLDGVSFERGVLTEGSAESMSAVVATARVTVRNCTFTDARLACLYLTAGAADGSRIHDNVFTNTSARQNSSLIYVAAGTANEDIHIVNNRVTGTCSDGVILFDARRCRVEGNYISGMTELPILTLTTWVNTAGNIWRTADRTDGSTRALFNNGVWVGAQNESTPTTPGSNEWGVSGGFVYVNLGGTNPNTRTMTSGIVSGYAITIYSSAIDDLADNIVAHNHIQDVNGFGIYLQLGVTSYNNKTIGNTLHDVCSAGQQHPSLPFAGISVSSGRNTVCVGDHIYICGWYGLWAANTATGRAVGVQVTVATSGFRTYTSNWDCIGCTAEANTDHGFTCHTTGAESFTGVQYINCRSISNGAWGLNADNTSGSGLSGQVIGGTYTGNSTGQMVVANTTTFDRLGVGRLSSRLVVGTAGGVESGGVYDGGSNSPILATAAATGTVYIRPNAESSGTGQAIFNTSATHLQAATTTITNALDHDGTTVGFYGTTPVAKQTGVAVSAAGVHAALVNLGLIT